MKALTKEIAELVESIPPEKAKTVVEFARFIAEKEDADAWDRKLSDPKYHEKLRIMADQARKDHVIPSTRIGPF